DACAEHRPVTVEQEPRGDAKLLLVAQIFDGRIDVAVEFEIADLGVGLGGPDREVDLVSADGEIALVDPVAVSDVDEPAVADPGSPDDVGYAPGQPGALRENIAQGSETIALADRARDRQVSALERPIEAVGNTRGILPTVVAGEAVEGEQVAVLEVDRPRIL